MKLSRAELAALAGLVQKAQGGETPPRPARRGKTARPRVLYLTAEEVESLFAAIREPRDRALFSVAYHRGLRASEVGLLRVEDLRLKAERLYVHRLKGSTSGEHHLTEHELRALRAWLRVRGWDTGPLFPSRRRRPISRQQLDVLMKQYGADAGLPREKRHFHCLKHSCATHLLERGESIEDVQDHIGHVNIQNTLIYAKITNRRREERARRLREW